jgi:hypothetical protein
MQSYTQEQGILCALSWLATDDMSKLNAVRTDLLASFGGDWQQYNQCINDFGSTFTYRTVAQELQPRPYGTGQAIQTVISGRVSKGGAMIQAPQPADLVNAVEAALKKYGLA